MMQTCQFRVSARGRLVLLSLLLVAAVLTGGGEAALQEPGPAGESSTPRVFFVSPQDGERVPAFEFGVNEIPVVFEFGIANYEIAAVPEEVEQARAGMGHFHLGVDTECLPAGEEIPQGAPWVHFGDASNKIEMMLEEPGEHTYAVQVGDDEHRTIAGLCETITIRVIE